MKKVIATLVLTAMLAACGQPATLGTREYPTHGLFNKVSAKSKEVCYEISAGNVIWSIILIETIVFPVYFIGWSLYNPVRLKTGPNDDCSEGV